MYGSLRVKSLCSFIEVNFTSFIAHTYVRHFWTFPLKGENKHFISNFTWIHQETPWDSLYHPTYPLRNSHFQTLSITSFTHFTYAPFMILLNTQELVLLLFSFRHKILISSSNLDILHLLTEFSVNINTVNTTVFTMIRKTSTTQGEKWKEKRKVN